MNPPYQISDSLQKVSSILVGALSDNRASFSSSETELACQLELSLAKLAFLQQLALWHACYIFVMLGSNIKSQVWGFAQSGTLKYLITTYHHPALLFKTTWMKNNPWWHVFKSYKSYNWHKILLIIWQFLPYFYSQFL